MFDGVPADQFHQFMASRTSLPIPLSFPLHGSSPSLSPAPPPAPPRPPPSSFTSFDHYPTHETLQQVAHHEQHSHLHHHHQLQHQHHQLATSTKDEKNNNVSTNLMVERDHHNHHRSVPDHESGDDPWSNDEVLTLLRIRSSMDSWFPDFTWEHVSRKLAEVGFKRSAEKCKEKFEEESRHFNSFSYNKNYRFLTELDELYQGDDNDDDQNEQVLVEKNPNLEKQIEEEKEKEEDSGNAAKENEEIIKKPVEESKKRKRKHKFEMLKGFCEAIVIKIISQQEALQKKFIEDLAKRDEEMMAKKEAWKAQEMDRLNKEIEIRAREQAISNDRQAKLIDLLKKIASNSSSSHHQNLAKELEDFLKLAKNPKNTTPSSSSDQTLSHHQNPSFSLQFTNTNVLHETSSSTQNPNSEKTRENPLRHTPSSSYKGSNKREDIGKRWPRDEVLALINLKCNSLININSDDNKNDQEVSKGPLWERISQRMQQLGYKRSAKRCKEKWENINKYFRKTKDNNKKRSLDSRTCPYFHQLNSLYNQGILVAPTDIPENRSPSPKHHRSISENASLASQSFSNDEDQVVLPTSVQV